jgi:hypothetical protein
MKRTRYTHFWATNRPLTEKEWYALSKDLKRICKTADELALILIKQVGNDSSIRVDAHEPHDGSLFVLTPEPVSFAYCCTNWEPYDVLVTASLLVAKRRLPDWIKLTSDGLWDAWSDGRALCSAILDYGVEDFERAKRDFDELLEGEDVL